MIGEERIEIEKGEFRKDYNEKSITKEIKTEKTKTDPYLTFISYQKADRGEKQQESNSLHIYTKQVVAQIKTLNDVDKVVANKDLIEKLARLEVLDKKKDTKIFIPQPIDTSDIELPKELMPLIEQISKNVHDVWAESRLKQRNIIIDEKIT